MPARSHQPRPSPSLVAALAEVPLLAGLPAELRNRLASEARTVRVAAGEWLFREGDDATSLFVTRSGRLEIVAAGPPPVVIRVLKRGSVVGELALLGAGTRSASAFARRDSELIEVRREQFEWLIANSPEFAVALTRSIGRQLASSRAPAPAAASPSTFGVVALDAAAPAAEVAELLAGGLAVQGSVALLRRDEAVCPDDRAALLDRAEREHDRVVLCGLDADAGGWPDFCCAEADIVIAVSSGTGDPAALARPAALHGCELLVVGRGVSERTLEVIAPRETQVVGLRSQLADAVDALARRLTGRALGLVLSGGGARAFAHLGVLDELLAAGLRIDRVGGTSLGAIVAGFVAMGLSPDEIHAIFDRDFVRRNPTNDYTLPAVSLIRGRKTRRMLRESFGDIRIEQLARRFYCVSCDLVARQAVVHRTGSLHEALYASIAIPGIFPPARDGANRLLVDGGVIDNLPVEAMARTGGGPVIAVDVGQRADVAGAGPAKRLGPIGRALIGSDVALPRIGETLMRTMAIGSADTVAAAARHADIVIAPRVDGVGMLDWKRLDAVREIGRRAAREALEQLDLQHEVARVRR